MRKTVENLVENVKNKLSDWGKKERRERTGCKRREIRCNVESGRWVKRGGKVQQKAIFHIDAHKKRGGFSQKNRPAIFKNRGYF